MLTIMAPDEVRKLSAAGVDFQLHTHSHNTPSESVRFGREIAVNRDVIQAITGRRAIHFCYPSGAYRPEFLPWLSGADVISATTCDPWLALHPDASAAAAAIRRRHRADRRRIRRVAERGGHAAVETPILCSRF